MFEVKEIFNRENNFQADPHCEGFSVDEEALSTRVMTAHIWTKLRSEFKDVIYRQIVFTRNALFLELLHF